MSDDFRHKHYVISFKSICLLKEKLKFYRNIHCSKFIFSFTHIFLDSSLANSFETCYN